MSDSTKKSNVKRDISGVFLLDKRQGVSSNKALQEVKHSFFAKKAGHTGALDPMATGLLPICLGEATKFSHYLLDADKGYIATLKLGEKTDSADAEGKVVESSSIPVLTQEFIQKTLSSFLGYSKQIPPMYSALKKDGKKLYELARQGIEVERAARDIQVKSIELVEYTEESLTFSVLCTKGTYIRVLGEDIAKKLGTLGHLTMLRRTQTGNFKLEDAYTIEQLQEMDCNQEKDSNLLPVYSSMKDFPRVTLDDTQTKRIQMGQRLNIHNQVAHVFESVTKEEMMVLMFNGEDFVGLGKLQSNGRLQPKKVIQ